MPSLPDSNAGHRWLIAAGTARYENLVGANLEKVPEERRRIKECLECFGYTQALQDISIDPTSSSLRETLQRWCQKEPQPDDLVVVYYSGHGVRDEDRFYLLTRDSVDREWDSTAVPAAELARWVVKGNSCKQVLVVLDACYSGAGAADFTEVAGRIATALGDGPTTFLIAAARSKQEANQGALSETLFRALSNDDGRLGGASQPFLAIDQIMGGVKRYLKLKHPNQRATWTVANGEDDCILFPNPRYRAHLPAGIDLETQRALIER